ncbi:hypothetical protein D3C78_1588260 [compost metagenome]
MADHVVDRGADRFRIRNAAIRCVVQRRRDGALHIDHVVVAELVQFVGGDAGFDEGRNVVEHFRSEPSGNAHFFDILLAFDQCGHAFIA